MKRQLLAAVPKIRISEYMLHAQNESEFHIANDYFKSFNI